MTPALLEMLAGVDPETLPDHTQLPDRDDKPVNNSTEHPQSALLTESLRPRLRELHPERDYFVGEDVGIYYRHVAGQPLRGCKSPDWYYVPGVPPRYRGRLRRSYVFWREQVSPLLVIEYVSGNGDEETDATPQTGKLWVYERAVAAHYYAIFYPDDGDLEVNELVDGRYQAMTPDDDGRFAIPEMRIRLGIWNGVFREEREDWLRAWDMASGAMMLHPEEAREADRRAHEEDRRAHEDTVDQFREMLTSEREQSVSDRARAQAEMLRADAEKKRAEAAETIAQQERERAAAADLAARQDRERAAAADLAARQDRERAARLAERLRALGIDPDAE